MEKENRLPGHHPGKAAVKAIKLSRQENYSPSCRYHQLRPHELVREWVNLSSPGSGDLRRLYALGVTRFAINRSGGLAVNKTRTTGDLWRPDPQGRPMLVTPVYDGPAPSIYCGVEYPVLLDLIAWTPAEPELMYWRTGNADVVGTDYLDRSLAGEPIRLFPSILEWLRAGCRGAVLLQERRAAA